MNDPSIPRPLDRARLDEIKSRPKAASDGPWTVGAAPSAPNPFETVEPMGRIYPSGVDTVYIGAIRSGRDEAANRAFVTHVHEDLTSLISEVDRLRAAIDRLVAVRGPS